MLLEGTQVPLALHGSRRAPAPVALALAASVPSSIPGWRASIEQALFEHYSPYAEAVIAGEEEAPSSGLPHIERPSDVWQHLRAVFLAVDLLDGRITLEIGYQVAWDEEHTLGARICDGQLVELCGSVLAP